VKRLLLVGGGHSHVEAVRRFGLSPVAGVEARLVSPDRYTPYSGMLPGLVAGHYSFEACHIDLEQLCGAAQVKFVRATVEALEPAKGVARLEGGREEPFDLLSLDIGSTPGTERVPGAAVHAVRVKPVAALLERWNALLAAARTSPQRIAVVGGGAGGIELAFAMLHRLRNDAMPGSRIDLVTDTPTILPGHAPAARRVFERLAVERGLALHCASRVARIEPGLLQLEGGAPVKSDWIFWATGASPARWLAASGLATDSRGFVSVHDSLRSVSHPMVFAAGDCASLQDRIVPKSGVFAVRQGPVLATNLAHALQGRPLARYTPQRVALALISSGGRHAVASWNGIAFHGDWVWRWKDRIDRQFMAKYRPLAHR